VLAAVGLHLAAATTATAAASTATAAIAAAVATLATTVATVAAVIASAIAAGRLAASRLTANRTAADRTAAVPRAAATPAEQTRFGLTLAKRAKTRSHDGNRHHSNHDRLHLKTSRPKWTDVMFANNSVRCSRLHDRPEVAPAPDSQSM
jgi:hypothetical protein